MQKKTVDTPQPIWTMPMGLQGMEASVVNPLARAPRQPLQETRRLSRSSVGVRSCFAAAAGRLGLRIQPNEMIVDAIEASSGGRLP
jgi:hypothetical protein